MLLIRLLVIFSEHSNNHKCFTLYQRFSFTFARKTHTGRVWRQKKKVSKTLFLYTCLRLDLSPFSFSSFFFVTLLHFRLLTACRQKLEKHLENMYSDIYAYIRSTRRIVSGKRRGKKQIKNSCGGSVVRKLDKKIGSTLSLLFFLFSYFLAGMYLACQRLG